METPAHNSPSSCQTTIKSGQHSPKQKAVAPYLDMGMLKLALELKRGSRSYEQAAKDAGIRVPDIHFSTIYNVEKGMVPSLNSYIKICMWLGVTLDKFIYPEFLPLLGVDPDRIANHKATPILLDEG